jgi:hypothetical protein
VEGFKQNKAGRCLEAHRDLRVRMAGLLLNYQKIQSPQPQSFSPPSKPGQFACAITAVENRNLRSLAQQRKFFLPAKCRVFGGLLRTVLQKNPEDAAFSGP